MTPRTNRERLLYALVPVGSTLPIAALMALVAGADGGATAVMVVFSDTLRHGS